MQFKLSEQTVDFSSVKWQTLNCYVVNFLHLCSQHSLNWTRKELFSVSYYCLTYIGDNNLTTVMKKVLKNLVSLWIFKICFSTLNLIITFEYSYYLNTFEFDRSYLTIKLKIILIKLMFKITVIKLNNTKLNHID